MTAYSLNFNYKEKISVFCPMSIKNADLCTTQIVSDHDLGQFSNSLAILFFG